MATDPPPALWPQAPAHEGAGPPPADHLDAVAWLGRGLLALCALALGAVAVHAARHTPTPATAQRALHWHSAGLRPPGAAGDPLTDHPGVPLGFAPGLSPLTPAVHRLVGR